MSIDATAITYWLSASTGIAIIGETAAEALGGVEIGGLLVGGAVVAGGALLIGAGWEAYTHFAQGNERNEYTEQARAQKDMSPCEWLRLKYQNASNSVERLKIQTAQKELGCRIHKTGR